MKKGIIGICIMALLVAATLSASALDVPYEYVKEIQDVGIHSVSYSVGYKGVCPWQGWTPIWVSLQGDATGFEGIVQLRIAGRDTVYQKEVTLQGKSGVTLCFPIDFHFQDNDTIEIQLISKLNKRYLYREKINATGGILRASGPLIGLITHDATSLFYWVSNEAGGLLAGCEYAELNAGNFPDRFELLLSFQVLVADNFDLGLLSIAQQEALRKWISYGGVFIAGGGSNAKVLFESYAKVLQSDISFVNSKALSPSEIFIYSDLSSWPQNKEITVAQMGWQPNVDVVLRGAGGNPLIALDHNKGGWVYYTAFELGGFFGAWPGATALWHGIFDDSLDANTLARLYSPFRQELNQTLGNGLPNGQFLFNVEPMDMPQLGWLLLIGVIFVILVGPLSYIVLKRMRRREWMWLTVPLIALLFSIGIYQMAIATRSEGPVANNIFFIEARQGSQTASTVGLHGVLIPSRGDYQITTGSKSALLFHLWDEETMINNNSMMNRSGETIDMGEAFHTISLSYKNTFSMQSFMSVDTSLLEKKAEMELRIYDQTLLGWIQNPVDATLENVFLVVAGQTVSIGELKPLERRQIHFELDAKGWEDGVWLQSAEPADQEQWLATQLPALFDLRQRSQSVRSEMWRYLYTASSMPAQDQVSLVGFLQDPPVKGLTINGNTKWVQQYGQVLLTLKGKVDLLYVNGQSLIPEGYLIPQADSSLIWNADLRSFQLKQNKTGTFTFTLPKDKGTQWTRALLDGHATQGTMEFSLYDWKQNRYYPVTLPYTFHLADMADFINAKGQIRISVQAADGQLASVSPPALRLEGVRTE